MARSAGGPTSHCWPMGPSDSQVSTPSGKWLTFSGSHFPYFQNNQLLIGLFLCIAVRSKMMKREIFVNPNNEKKNISGLSCSLFLPCPFCHHPSLPFCSCSNPHSHLHLHVIDLCNSGPQVTLSAGDFVDRWLTRRSGGPPFNPTTSGGFRVGTVESMASLGPRSK